MSSGTSASPTPAASAPGSTPVSAPDWAEWKPVVKAVVGRPDLWSTALRQAVLLAPKGWWRHWPPIPMPAAGYLRFRMLTAYGDPDQAPTPGDVVTWLEWARSWGSVTSAGHERAGGENPSQADLPRV